MGTEREGGAVDGTLPVVSELERLMQVGGGWGGGRGEGCGLPSSCSSA